MKTPCLRMSSAVRFYSEETEIVTTMSGLCTAVVPMRNYLWGDNHAH